MNCADARQLLHAYIDDELDVATAAQLNAHLLECTACAQALEAAKAVKIAAGNPALYYRSPAALREQMIAAIPPAAPSRSRWRAVAIAASILLVAGVTFAVFSPVWAEKNSELAILDLHLRSMQLPGHLVDVVSTDQHTVKPWFDGKLDFAPPVWQLADKGFPLDGGRIDYIHARPVAALVYRRAQHIINLFIWPGTASPSQQIVQGYNFVQWNAGGDDVLRRV